MKLGNFFEKAGIEVPPSEKSDSEKNPLVVAHFTSKVVIEGQEFDSDWYVIGGEEMEDVPCVLAMCEPVTDWYLFGLARILVPELGTFTLSQILRMGAKLDENWTPKGIYDIYEDFDLRG